jgi:hypothetical protein
LLQFSKITKMKVTNNNNRIISTSPATPYTILSAPSPTETKAMPREPRIGYRHRFLKRFGAHPPETSLFLLFPIYFSGHCSRRLKPSTVNHCYLQCWAFGLPTVGTR